MTPSGTTHFVYDREDRLIAETDGAGTSVREYIWLGEVPVAVLDGTSSTTNPTLLWAEPAMSRAEGHANHLAQPELMTDAARTVVWSARYEPFGAVSSITGTAANPLRFPGQWFQLEAGLHYNWHRHYDPTTGRYTQADPLGLAQGPAPTSGGSTVAAPNGVPGLSLGRAPLGGGDLGGQTGLLATLAALAQDGRQDGLGLAVPYPANPAATTLRDGPSLYGYAGQSPGMRTDPDGRLLWLPALVAAGVAILWPEPANAPGDGDIVIPSDPAGPYVAGAVAGMSSAGALYCAMGREFSVGNNWRFAPGGNRTGNPYGRWPHYHRKVPNPNKPGESIPGQGIGRHRPWEPKSGDQSFLDRF